MSGFWLQCPIFKIFVLYIPGLWSWPDNAMSGQKNRRNKFSVSFKCSPTLFNFGSLCCLGLTNSKSGNPCPSASSSVVMSWWICLAIFVGECSGKLLLKLASHLVLYSSLLFFFKVVNYERMYGWCYRFLNISGFVLIPYVVICVLVTYEDAVFV